MNRWYRAYEGTCADPKLAEAAMVAGCSRSVAVATWHMILENAARVNDEGRIEIPPRRIAAALCEPLDLMEAVFDAFTSIGLLADSHVTAWKRRQYESDKSTERVRKHRKAKQKEQGNGDETLHSVSETPPETETDIPLPIGNGREASAIDLRKAVFDSGVRLLTEAGHDDRQARSILGRFRKTHSDGAVLIALAKCQAEEPSDPIAWLTATLNAEKTNERRFQSASTGDISREVIAALGG